MTQLNLNEAVHEAKRYLTSNDFEAIFELADNALRLSNREIFRSEETEDFRLLMVYAWVAAFVFRTRTVRRLLSEGLKPEERNNYPYLRKAVDDTHGIYRLWNLENRYMRSAGVTSASSINAVFIRAVKITEWYDNRPVPVLEAAVSITRKGWIRKFFSWFDQIDYERMRYLTMVQIESRRQLAALTP